MKYISLFSGIGGLEMEQGSPEYLCDSDRDCHVVLRRVFPCVPIHEDVRCVPSVKAEVCLAGWPCQDLTIAGRQTGIFGKNSSLFFHAVTAAKSSGVHTFIGENVPNLLRARKGHDFRVVIETLAEAGFPFISWRTLNARQFGLPQDRDRVIIVASKERSIARALHRGIEHGGSVEESASQRTSGFYWTGGKRSICFSEGFVPTLKVGASPPKGGTSPVAVLYEKTVRKLSALECLQLQGFDSSLFEGIVLGSVFRMAGNAVPLPMGRFAAGSVHFSNAVSLCLKKAGLFCRDGIYDDQSKQIFCVESEVQSLAENLDDFIDFDSTDSLSNQAAAGLLVRMISAGKKMPIPLFDVLYDLSLEKTKLRGTKVDSFDILHNSLDVDAYRKFLENQAALAEI